MKSFLKTFFKIYLFTWIFCFIFFCVIAYINNVKIDRLFSSFATIISTKRGLFFLHGLFIFFIIITLIFKYIRKTYQQKGSKKAFYNFSLKVVLPILILIYVVKFLINYNNSENFDYQWNYAIENNTAISKQRFLKDDKIRGMNVYNIGRRKNDSLLLQEIVKNNIEWVAVIPYFYQENENSKKINAPKTIGLWSKRDSLLIAGITKLQKKGLFTMIKPHLWMSSGWRSNISFEDKNDWNVWFTNYRKAILHYATMADKTNAKLFCIGTELRSSLEQKPNAWLQLIKEIKNIYKGKLTYAANWDETFEFKEFWEELDYIGVQAYYPLTKNKNPSLEDIKEGWKPYIKQLKEISSQLQKPILFTEVGYRSDVYATAKPWAWGSTFERLYKKKSDKTQLLAYKAMYQSLWNEPWFVGTFPWEWNSGDFPIYKKPAQNEIAIWYAK